MRRFLEVGANIAIILVALLLGTGLTLKYLRPEPKVGNASYKQIPENKKFNLPGFHWAKGESTVVLAFSTECGFCLTSTDFYRRLAVRNSERNDVRVIVVGPQPVDELKGFFQERSIPIDEFVQVQLSDISVGGTPTLVLIGDDGLVKGSWVGKLPPEAEAEVFLRVFDRGPLK